MPVAARIRAPGIGVVVFFVGLQQVESNVLLPNIMRQQSDVRPLLVIVALLLGGSVGGILGALVAIPLIGALRVLIVRVVAPWVRGWSGAEGGNLPCERI